MRDRAQQQLTADYVVVALPASTLRSVRFDAVASRAAVAGDLDVCATAAPRACCCSSSRGSGSTSAGRLPTARDQPTGAVWDGNEQQERRPGILSLLAGGTRLDRSQRHHRHAGMARAGEAAGMARHAVAAAARPHRRLGSRQVVERRLRGLRYALRSRAAAMAGAPGRPDRLCRRAHEHDAGRAI